MTERKVHIRQSVDWVLVGLYLLLVFIGWISIYAATHSTEPGSLLDWNSRAGKQFVWILTALGLAIVILYVLPPKLWEATCIPFYVFVLGLLVLVIAVVGGFAWAVKTGKLSTEDVAMINKELGLYRLPYVGNGKYFEVPEGVEWPPKEESKPEAESETPEDTPVEPEKPKPAEKPTEVKIDRKAIEEQRLKREAEEKKRVTRLARIYENMKPEAAANALINVDWDTTVLIFQRMSEDSVAQILSKMEPEAAAQLTEMLFAGTQRRVTTPYDTMRGEPVNEPYTE